MYDAQTVTLRNATDYELSQWREGNLRVSRNERKATSAREAAADKVLAIEAEQARRKAAKVAKVAGANRALLTFNGYTV